MTDILMAKIQTSIETYTQNMRSLLSGVLHHVQGFGHLDKNTLTGFLEQASDHTIVFQQSFEVNFLTFLKFSPPTLDSILTMTNLSKEYERYLNFVGLTFAFTLDLGIDQDDYPVLRTLMSPLRDSVEKLASCYKSIQHFLVLTQPPTTGTMTTQIETEDQATQDNAPATPCDTPRHPVAHPDTEHDFEHDPDLDSDDQNILAIESTDTLDNPIDNSDHTFDNVHNSSISDCTDIKQTVDNSDIGDPNASKTEPIDDNMQDQTSNIDKEDQDNSEFQSTETIHIDNNIQDFNRPLDFTDHNSSIVIKAEINNSHKESKPIESEDTSDSKSFESERIHDLDIDSDVDSECDFDDLEAIYLDMCKNFRTKIPARKPMPLFSFR